MPERLTDLSTDRLGLLQVHLGGDRNFCYLIADPASGEGAAVDPAFAPDQMLAIAHDHGIHLRHVLLTHGHRDHTAGAGLVQAQTGAVVHAGGDDSVDGAEPIADGAQIVIGQLMVTALHTPGHSPGHTCYLVAGHVFTGDLLFCGKVGGTGSFFPGSSAEAEWRSLQRLLTLPDETVVLPGHDYYGGEGSMPQSTIGHERRHNPFLNGGDFAAFVALKANWAEYKRTHGIR